MNYLIHPGEHVTAQLYTGQSPGFLQPGDTLGLGFGRDRVSGETESVTDCVVFSYINLRLEARH